MLDQVINVCCRHEGGTFHLCTCYIEVDGEGATFLPSRGCVKGANMNPARALIGQRSGSHDRVSWDIRQKHFRFTDSETVCTQPPLCSENTQTSMEASLHPIHSEWPCFDCLVVMVTGSPANYSFACIKESQGVKSETRKNK